MIWEKLVKSETGRIKDHFWSGNPIALQKARSKTVAGRPQEATLKKRRVNIALAAHWREIGKRIAVEKKLSFSAYVERLIYTDSLCNESVE